MIKKIFLINLILVSCQTPQKGNQERQPSSSGLKCNEIISTFIEIEKNSTENKERAEVLNLLRKKFPDFDQEQIEAHYIILSEYCGI